MITVLLPDHSACLFLYLLCKSFRIAASRALPSMFAIWQAMQICNSLHSSHSTFHILLTSRAVSGWMVHNLASSVPIRTCALFCTSSLGTHPKPRDRTLCELRVFCKTLLYVHIVVDDPNEIFYIHFHTDVHF